MSTTAPLAQLTINPEMIRGVVETQIQAAIVAQLQQTPNLIESVVAMAMKTKVNEQGRIGQYSSDNRYDLISVLCRNAIQEYAQIAVREWVQEQKPEIVKAIRKHLTATKTKVVQQFVAAAEKALSPDFYISCSLKLPQD